MWLHARGPSQRRYWGFEVKALGRREEFDAWGGACWLLRSTERILFILSWADDLLGYGWGVDDHGARFSTLGCVYKHDVHLRQR